MSKGRLEAFSDGVLAIAVTLLALNLPIPPDKYPFTLAHFVAHSWPSYAAYLDSFLIIGIIWLNHHALFGAARVVTRATMLVNLSLLLWVVSIPYTTSLFAKYLLSGGWDARVAAAIYSGVMLGMSVSFLGIFELLGRSERRLDPSLSVEAHQVARRRFGAGILGYLVSVGLAFVSAPATLILQFAISGYYLFDQLGDRPGGRGVEADTGVESA